MFNKFLIFVQVKSGFLHWLLQRLSACIILLLIVFFFNCLQVIFFIISILTFHASLGIETLINDYIHNHQLHLFGCVVLRIFVLFFIKTIFIFFI